MSACYKYCIFGNVMTWNLQLGCVLQNKKSKYLIIKVKNLEALVSKLVVTFGGVSTSQGTICSGIAR